MEFVTRFETSHEGGDLLVFSSCIDWVNSFHQLLHFGNILINSLSKQLLVVVELLLPHRNSGIIPKVINEWLTKGNSWLCIILGSDIPVDWIGCLVGLSFLDPSLCSAGKISRGHC